VLFGIPLLGVLCGALGMHWIAPFPSEDLNTLLGSAAGLALGVAAARATATLGFPNQKHTPQAIEILSGPTASRLTVPSCADPSQMIQAPNPRSNECLLHRMPNQEVPRNPDVFDKENHTHRHLIFTLIFSQSAPTP
jgi:hypothetical protein